MEILVTIAVLSITLMTIYRGFASTLQINQATEGLWKAILFTNNELARVERSPIPEVSIQQGEYRDDHPMAGYAWHREVLNEEPFPGVKVRKVVFKLSWKSGEAAQFYQAQTYVPTQ